VKIISFALVAMLATAVSGCSEDRPERADTVTGATQETSPTSGESAEAPEVAAGALTQAQVEAALLTLEDLPSGWSINTSSADFEESEDTTEPPECGVLFDSLDEAAMTPVAKAEAEFTAGDLGPFLFHAVQSFEEDVAGHIESVTDVLNQCPEFSSTDAAGVRTEFSTAPLSFPNLGDQTWALRLQGSSQDIDIVFDVVSIALGQNLITLVAVGFQLLQPIPGSELESAATTAVQKLEAAANT
jgi:hypothetical protein